MTHRYTFDELVSQFSGVLGVERASTVVRDAAESAGIDVDEPFHPGDVIKTCTGIRRRESGSVSVIAEQLLVQAQGNSRFDDLFEGLPDPAVVVEFIDEEPIVRATNSQFEAVFGYAETDVLGTSLNDALIPEDPDVPGEYVDDKTLAGERVELEVQRRTADGEIRDFLFRTAPFENQADRIEAYGVYTDITDRIHRERELERQVELLDRFAETVSHDLKNPLNVARGYLELARETSDAPELEAIARVHGRMEALVDDLLTLARQGRAIGETESVDLEPLVRSVWATIDEDGSSLELDADLGRVEADPVRLRALVENLLANAVEHAGPETTITVRATEAGFAVCDDGPGIDPEVRRDVFEHGFTTRPSGTGFGLSIVESVASAHGWELAVDESPAGGASFEVQTYRVDA